MEGRHPGRRALEQPPGLRASHLESLKLTSPLPERDLRDAITQRIRDDQPVAGLPLTELLGEKAGDYGGVVVPEPDAVPAHTLNESDASN